MDRELTISLEEDADLADLQYLKEGLDAFNRGHVAGDGYRPLNLFLRRADGTLAGGLLGCSCWGWFHINIFWLEADCRRQGYGSKILAAAEAEAARRGCRFGHLDTMSFQSLPFYQRHGYTVFGTLDQFPAGHQRHYLWKALPLDAPPPEPEPEQEAAAGWDEAATRAFLDYGRYFVPQRDHQIDLLARLVPPYDGPGFVLELGCGEGLLAEALLARCQRCHLIGMDGSPEMLRRAEARLSRFPGRFKGVPFDLADSAWRHFPAPLHAVLSSLALHHLDDAGKRRLFTDMFRALAPGGALIIADIIKPARAEGWAAAADEWDALVLAQSRALDGNDDGFTAFQELRWNMFRHFDPDDIDHPATVSDQMAWMRQAGFSGVDLHWMRAGHAIFSGVKPGPA